MTSTPARSPRARSRPPITAPAASRPFRLTRAGCAAQPESWSFDRLCAGFLLPAWLYAADVRLSRIMGLSIALVLVVSTTALAYLQRTVNGPATVVPGHVYTFYVSGFHPGERVYPTVQPASCARTSERCEQSPCPSCAPVRISRSGTATVKFRWPTTSLYVIANMDFRHPQWRRHSYALVRIDLASLSVPSACQRMTSLTANSRAGSVVCAATLTVIH